MFDKKAEVETAIRNGQGWIRIILHLHIYIIYIYLLVVEWNLPLIQQPVGKGHLWIYWF